ncbi:MAG: tetratricopeptide repeat protein [Planctomycetes bacterium]|nr:tetratricopeptide repeat protein [Planctomycetota bacterium]
MALRKEQALLLATGGLLALLVVLSRGAGDSGGTPRAKTKSYERIAIPGRIVSEPAALDAAQARDPFLVPTRTVPLTPLDWPELELPPLPDMPLVRPPLPLGPAVPHYDALRVDPHAFAVVLKPESNEAAPADVSDGGDVEVSASTTTQAGSESAWELTYDRVETTDNRSYWGQVLGDNRFLQGSTTEGDPRAVSSPFRAPVLLRRVDPETGKIIVAQQTFEPGQVGRVVFANTIDNRIALARRRIPGGEDGLRERERLIARLLGPEGQHPEALDEAVAQARTYIEIAPSDKRGFELLLEVYARTGEFEKEMELLDELAGGPLADAAFVARERGILEARLGLDEVAEEHLREALRKEEGDPRNALALSRYLADHGAESEALRFARLAKSRISPAHAPSLRFDVLFQLARAALAEADVDLAARTLDEASVVASGEQILLLRGSVALAKGDVAGARSAFVSAAASLPDSVEALVGAGICSFLEKNNDEALAAFRNAESRDPLMRQLALAAQGFLMLLDPARIGDAVAVLERARTVAPRDPYVLYLLGRAFRKSQRYAEAREVLDTCLRQRFDFVEAAMELARVELEEARLGGSGAFELLENAERIAARACSAQLERGKEPLYHELLGIVRYHLRKNDRARVALETAQSQGGEVHSKLWLALLRNRLGHTPEAVAMLRDTAQYIKGEDDPFKAWAEVTQKRLAFHRGKRQLSDDFEAHAAHWRVERKGQEKIRWVFGEGQLAVRGETNTELPCFARYTIDRGGDFVSVSIDADFGATSAAEIYLRVSDEKEAGGGNLRSTIDARLGFNGKYPFAYLRRGAQENEKTTTKFDAQDRPDAFPLRRGEFTTLEIEYEVDVSTDAEEGSMVLRWGGQEIARQKMRIAAGNRELYIDIRCVPKLGSKVDARFAKFRLVRLGQ